jgi:hypothetical protein
MIRRRLLSNDLFPMTGDRPRVSGRQDEGEENHMNRKSTALVAASVILLFDVSVRAQPIRTPLFVVQTSRDTGEGLEIAYCKNVRRG